MGRIYKTGKTKVAIGAASEDVMNSVDDIASDVVAASDDV